MDCIIVVVDSRKWTGEVFVSQIPKDGNVVQCARGFRFVFARNFVGKIIFHLATVLHFLKFPKTHP